jgi:lysophospholipase L1-like esterase
MAIPVALIALEIIARLGSGYITTGKDSENKLSREAIAYSLRFVDDDEKVYQGLDNRGELLAMESLSTAYHLVGNQQNEFFSLNEQGFRDDDPVPLEKPAGEIRIFVLGNSAAFGRGVQANEQTLETRLEQRLQQRVQQQKQSPGTYRPDVFPFFKPTREKLMKMPAKIRQGNYRVINVAVPGYSSGNELAQFAMEILPYQPDLVVVMNGYEDLLLPEDQAATAVPKLAEFAKDPDSYFRQYLRHSLQEKLQKSALIRAIASLAPKKKQSQVADVLSIRERNQESLAKQLPTSEESFQARLDRYRLNMQRFVSLCSAAKIPLIVAVQPEITGRSPDKLDPTEQQVIKELSSDYTEKVSTYYPEMVDTMRQLEKSSPTNLKVLDFYRLNDAFPAPSFVDPIHFNEAAHDQMAEDLYRAITGLSKMQIIPENYYLD